MCLLVLKKIHNKGEIYLRPIYKDDDKKEIIGVKWVDDHFDIEIKHRMSK